MAKIYSKAAKQKARNLRSQDRVKRTQKKDYRGICRIVYYDTSLQFELQAIGEAVIKNGAGEDRTLDPFHAMEVLSQLSYSPVFSY